jgi:2-polyprenyl-6-methoxyphenol hydroxylase-like FAD-dependent oxidoreductase
MAARNLDVDVAVVGASLAGCTTAHLLGREGLRVALVEKHGDIDAYKRLCGHYIQSSATPVLRRLGVDRAIEAAGGVRNGADFATPWGVLAPRPRPGEPRPYGYSVRRLKLDPMIRRLALETAGVRYLGGNAAVALQGDGRRCDGVVVRDRGGRETAIRARLVVGADGRGSTTAKLAGAAARTHVNNRFCYMAYFEGVERTPDDRTWLWLLDRALLIAAPNDEGLTLLAAFPHKERLPAFKADREGAFTQLVGTARGGPSLAGGRRVSRFVGYTDYPPVTRPVVPRDGVALAGDAALTCDPLLAIGCGFALQSAAWLADSVLPALQGEEPLRRGLRRYRRRHHRELAGHARMLNAGARAEPPNPIERLMMRAAVRDPESARHFERFVSRSTRVRTFLAPAAVARAAWVNARPDGYLAGTDASAG